jgi:hypothetical protein
MAIDQVTAPSYDRLRPFKPRTSNTFPVYPDLVDRLVTTQDHPNDDLRFVMAVCSSYAYGDVTTLGDDDGPPGARGEQLRDGRGGC